MGFNQVHDLTKDIKHWGPKAPHLNYIIETKRVLLLQEIGEQSTEELEKHSVPLS